MGSCCGLGQHGMERVFSCVLISIGISFVAPAVGAITTEALLDSLQHTASDFFWNEANPSNGLIKDRNTSGSPCSIASVGFGLTAICIGIDHGWVSREVGRDRVLTTLQTLWTTPQGSGPSGFCGYQGLYYHFLDMNTATRVWDSELSTIDTALLFAGVLDAKEQLCQGNYDPPSGDVSPTLALNGGTGDDRVRGGLQRWPLHERAASLR